MFNLGLQAANSLENTAPFDRHSFDANASFGVDKFVMADYYLRPFRAAIQGGGARGIMCTRQQRRWAPFLFL